MSTRPRNRTNWLIGLALVCITFLGAGFAFWSTMRTLRTLQAVQHTLEVRLELQHAVGGLVEAESAERAYLLTGKKELLEVMAPKLEVARGSLRKLRALTDLREDQKQRLDRLSALFEKRISRMADQVKARDEHGLEAAASMVGTPIGKQVMGEIRSTVTEMEATEDGVLVERSLAARSASRATVAVVTGGSVVVFLLIILAAWLTRRELAMRRDLTHVQEVARAYAERMVDTVREPLLVVCPDGRVERANRAYYQAFQTSPAETEQRQLAELGDGQWNDPRLDGWLKAAFREDRDFDDVEWEHDFPGIGRRTLLLSGRKLHRPDGLSDAILLAIEDVTKRKHAENELRESEARFRMIVDSVADYSIIMLDAHGTVVSWNPGAEYNSGYKADEIIGRHFSRFYPAEEVSAGRPEAELAEAREHGRVEDEGWRVRKDGTRYFANVVVSAIRDERGQLKGYAKIVRDISERHRIEQMHIHFRALFDSLPGLYVVLSPDLTIMAVSDAYLQSTMTTREAILGRNLFEVFPDNPETPAAPGEANLRASLQRVMKTLRTDTMSIQRYDIRRPDGTFEERYWSPTNSPVLGAGEKLEYIIHRVEDVTEFVMQRERVKRGEEKAPLPDRLERMEAEIFRSSQQVHAVNQQLRAANAELESFSYSVSHDLRAPLRHIDGFADLLLNHASVSLDDKGRRYLKTISDSAKRMGALIDDLLVFSRIGRADLKRTKVDLNSLVEAVIQELRVETDGRNVVWQRQNLPSVEGDVALLRQVLVNLLANAVKYTRPRDPAIIEVGSMESGAEHTLYVRDNGVGFDMTYVGKLFGVFQRLHRSDEFEGTGIGLANVQRIISRHGGRVWAEGKSNQGATFYFTLPIGAGSTLSINETTDPSP